MNFNWLLQMAKWARRPPSMKQVRFMAVIVGIALLIVVVDKLGLWPEWANLGKPPRIH